jgi:hypothetical protein
MLQACGIAASIKDLYWDVRPKPEFGTVEIRVCDTPLSIESATALAALAQALSRWLLRTRPDLQVARQVHVARYNKFQACRYGMAAMISDPVALGQRPLRESLAELLELLAADARELGCTAWLDHLQPLLADDAADAAWLRGMQRLHGNLNDVVREAAERLLARPAERTPGDLTMKRRLTMLALLLATTISTAHAAPSCQFDAGRGRQRRDRPMDRQDNWLAVENQRVSLQAADVFMPARRLRPAAGGEALRAAPRPLDIDRLETTDPFDGRKRDLGFLLDSRLEADGVLVLHNGRILSERYRNGLRAERATPAVAGDETHCWRFGRDECRPGQTGGRQGRHPFHPGPEQPVGLAQALGSAPAAGSGTARLVTEELAQWRQAGGWTSSQPATGIRSWLSQPGRWDKPLVEQEVPPFAGSPDDDLLAWLLAESNAIPLARLFCEQLLIRSRHEHPVFWLTDSQGIELADGLGLSLRDFGRLGQLLLDARVSRSRSRIPAWFVETLTASSGIRSPEVPGLPKGSEQRYGFMHLGGKPNRVAIIGPHGTSLYVDFDRRLVIAVYATYPKWARRRCWRPLSSSGKSSTRRPARHGNAEHDAYLSRSATKNRLRCLRDVAAELKMTETTPSFQCWSTRRTCSAFSPTIALRKTRFWPPRR